MPTVKEKPAAPVALELPVFGSMTSFTGEAVRIPRLEVPLIRISYKADDDDSKVAPKGEFVEYNPATKVSVPLGKMIKVQILHHRQSLSAYKQMSGGSSESYYTPEISMKAKSAPLFMATAGADGKRVQRYLLDGDISKNGPLRTEYPELRYQRSLYVLHEGKLKNLVVYGASFSGFIDFTKAIQGQSSGSVMVEISTKKEKTGTVIFYPIVFTPKEKIDPALSEPVQKQLYDWFEQYDARVAIQQKERREQAANDRGDGPTEPYKPPLDGDRPTTMAEEIQHGDEDEEARLLAEAEKMLG